MKEHWGHYYQKDRHFENVNIVTRICNAVKDKLSIEEKVLISWGKIPPVHDIMTLTHSLNSSSALFPKTGPTTSLPHTVVKLL